MAAANSRHDARAYSGRLAVVQAAIAASADGHPLIVDSLTDLLWLTGLDSSNAAAVVTVTESFVVTDGRYADVARETRLPVVIERDVVGTCRKLAGGAQLASESKLVADLRMVKDTDEMALLARAAEISLRALEACLRQIAIGESELLIARRLEFEMAKLGADDRSFPSIVASGPNSAVPHHRPTDRPLEAGDILKIDFGAMVGGYHADCTRTFVVGADPTVRQMEVHGLVAEAAARARDAVAPGISYADLDGKARSVIAEAGFGSEFVHGLGHGVGLDVHEPPLLAATSVGTLSPGNVVTIEPGIYLPGEFGVRIEDMCAVKESGHQVLTEFPRDLVRIGR